jgi:SAM-dependent methyltransferase
MKELIKLILKRLKIYYLLQSRYRSIINFFVTSYYRISYNKYRNGGFECNFCGARFQKFVPDFPPLNIKDAIEKYQVIAGYGENVFCPRCLSKNRERLVKVLLTHYLDLSGKKILHFSPEKNVFNYIKSRASVITVDIEPGFYKSIDSKVNKADITQLPYNENEFDLIICNHILEHVPDDLKAISELYRVLKKDGYAIVQIPFSETLSITIEDPKISDPHLQEKLFAQKDHVRIYALKDFLSRLYKTGFVVRLITDEELQQYAKYALQPHECGIIIRKQ